MKHILITGGTKGIGRACVEYFGRRGWSVSTCARHAEDLAALRTFWAHNNWSGTLNTFALDLNREEAVERVPRAAYEAIILNAAAYQPGQLLTEERDIFTELFALNVRSNHLLARRLVPALVARNAGHLLIIGSSGTDHWKTHMTAYVATKYALRGLFLGWQQELINTGVRCTLVAPGATLTASWDGEQPPSDILRPETVAEVVGLAIEEGRNGRLLV